MHVHTRRRKNGLGLNPSPEWLIGRTRRILVWPTAWRAGGPPYSASAWQCIQAAALPTCKCRYRPRARGRCHRWCLQENERLCASERDWLWPHLPRPIKRQYKTERKWGKEKNKGGADKVHIKNLKALEADTGKREKFEKFFKRECEGDIHDTGKLAV